MTNKSIHTLVIEDNEGDYILFKNALGESELVYKLHREKTLHESIDYLKKNACDSILVDLELPDSSGIETLNRIMELNPDCSIVVLTGNINEQLGVKAMKMGAQDYLIKSNLNPASLPRIIRYAYERKETERLLQNHQAILEEEVAKRTSELIESNKRLRDEIEMRKKIEKSLAESEENFRLISLSAKDAIIKMDFRGRVAFWNPAAERLMGYSEKEIIGKDAHELLVPAEKKDDARQGVNNFLATGKGKLIGNTVEIDVLRKDGNKVPMEISLSKLKSQNGKYQAVGIIRDISERRRAENKIRENNMMLQTLINTIPVPIFYKDTKGKYQGGNLAFYRFLGKKPEDVIARSVHEVVEKSKLADTFKKMDEELLKSGTRQVYETTAIQSNGEERDVIFHKAAYKNSDDEVAGLVGIFIDVTDTKQVTKELTELKEHLEEKVAKRTAELQHANATKDKFFSIIAHDLKSPFNIIQGFLTLIHDEFDEFDRSELKEFISKTLEASTNTFSLLENLLEWSRSQRGTIEYKPMNINLSEISNEAVYQLKDAAKDKNIRIVNNIDTKTLAYADPNMARAIFRNLITNAVKFSYSSGEISVSSTTSKGENVVCVQDQGIGMGKEFVKNLFKINEKTQRQGTHKEKGTGLGLILCKEFVEKNNGKIWVESYEDKGSSFYFSLPVVSDMTSPSLAV